MQQQERVRHLLRRFGLGASPKEVRVLEAIDLDRAIDRLIDFEKADEPYPISPWEFTCNPNDMRLNTNGRVIGDWWALKMATTTRPMQEKLALFWHDHFAVGDDKVQDGRKMLQYLQVLRTHGSGNFGTLLREVSKTPAMMVYLDSTQNVRGRPNENFAREVMELFTLGVDNGYTEGDIREAARALTGWTFRDTLNYRERETNPVENQMRAKIAEGQEIFEYAYAANRHEQGNKTIFGNTGDYAGDDVIQLLLAHPETPRTICRKLWEWFVYPDPDERIVERLSATFLQGGYEIKPVLRAIAGSPEFWSEKAMRTKVKSPVDFSVGIVRSFGAVSVLDKREAGEIDPFTPIANEIRQLARILNLQMRRQGLELLYPPSVEGWHWDDEWITTETMLYRIDFAKQFFSNRRMVAPLIEWSMPEFAVEPSRTADPACVDRLLTMLDIELGPSQRYTLSRFARDLSLNDSLYNERARVDRLWQFLKVVFAMPQAHLG